jgi:hypothetical protein
VEGGSDGPERIACGAGADLIYQFQLERGGDGTKYCQKIKMRQRARLGSIGRKCTTGKIHSFLSFFMFIGTDVHN